MIIKGLSDLIKVRNVKILKNDLINFEEDIKISYEKGFIKGPIHLSRGNEDILIEIFQYISKKDFVFTAWRNHYHAILHEVPIAEIKKQIYAGCSMSLNSKKPFIYSSSIVGGIIPIALGTALAQKKLKSRRNVWCFIGDMTMETGIFHEAYKYSENFNLPLKFIIEDNNLSVHTPTLKAWGKKMKPPKNVIYYKYKNFFPHHGTGKWVNF